MGIEEDRTTYRSAIADIPSTTKKCGGLYREGEKKSFWYGITKCSHTSLIPVFASLALKRRLHP